MLMEKEVLDNYIRAGMIAAKAKREAEKILRPGLSLIVLAETVEKFIRDNGAEPAFPLNISLNENAAHYTPPYGDRTEIKPGDLVKIDIGAHVDGYIGDMAFTYCSEKSHLARAAENILADAIKVIRPGVKVSEIGCAIEDSAKSNGVGIIVNLTGHTLERFVFHGAPGIPNVKNDISHSFNEGDVIALEPFTCPTNGLIRESGGGAEIFRYLMDRPARLPEARQILGMARDRFHELPFAKRWLTASMSPVKVAMAMRQLESLGALEPYPVLREVSGKPIAQAEHTIIVADKPIITTRMDDG